MTDFASPWYVQQSEGAGVPRATDVNSGGIYLLSDATIPTGVRTQTPWTAFFPTPLGRVVTDGATFNGSGLVTSVSAKFTQADIGSGIMGTGLSDGAFSPCQIVAIVNPTTVLISNPASATATGVTLIIDPVCGIGPTIAGGASAYLNVYNPGRYNLFFSPAWNPVGGGTHRTFDFFAANWPEDPVSRYFDLVDMAPQTVIDIDNPTFYRPLTCNSAEGGVPFFVETFHTQDSGGNVTLRSADAQFSIGLG